MKIKVLNVFLSLTVLLFFTNCHSVLKESISSQPTSGAKPTTYVVPTPPPSPESLADARGFIVRIGDTVPNIDFMLMDSTVTSLDSLKGKVVLLQFTASWCSVCRKEMPAIEQEIWQAHRDENFVIIGIDRDEPLPTVRKFATQMQISYPLALDPDADIFGQFALKRSGVTRNVLIDQHGQIVFLTRLFNRTEFEELKAKINELLEK